MQLLKLTCNYISLHTVTWACMQLHELTCSYMRLHSIPWSSMQLHELACSSLSLHAVPWTFMMFNELTWSSRSLHAVSWACMQLLSLSEQLTRISQCLLKYILVSVQIKHLFTRTGNSPKPLLKIWLFPRILIEIYWYIHSIFLTPYVNISYSMKSTIFLRSGSRLAR